MLVELPGNQHHVALVRIHLSRWSATITRLQRAA